MKPAGITYDEHRWEHDCERDPTFRFVLDVFENAALWVDSLPDGQTELEKER